MRRNLLSLCLFGVLFGSLLGRVPLGAQVPVRPVPVKPVPLDRPILNDLGQERPIAHDLEVLPMRFGALESFEGSSQGAIERVAAVSQNREILLAADFLPELHLGALSLPSGREFSILPFETSFVGELKGAYPAIGSGLGVQNSESFLTIFSTCLVGLFRLHLGSLSLQATLPNPPPYEFLQSITCADIAQAPDTSYYVSTTEQVEGTLEPLGFVWRYLPGEQRWSRRNRFADLILHKGPVITFDAQADQLVILVEVDRTKVRVLRTTPELDSVRLYDLPESTQFAPDLVSFAGLDVVAVRDSEDQWFLLLIGADGEVQDRLPMDGPVRALALEPSRSPLGVLASTAVWVLGARSGQHLHRIPLTRQE